MRISDWSSDVCSSDLPVGAAAGGPSLPALACAGRGPALSPDIADGPRRARLELGAGGAAVGVPDPGAAAVSHLPSVADRHRPHRHPPVARPGLALPPRRSGPRPRPSPPTPSRPPPSPLSPPPAPHTHD